MNAYMWNLDDGTDKPIFWVVVEMQTENRLVDTVGEGEVGTN